MTDYQKDRLIVNSEIDIFEMPYIDFSLYRSFPDRQKRIVKEFLRQERSPRSRRKIVPHRIISQTGHPRGRLATICMFKENDIIGLFVTNASGMNHRAAGGVKKSS